MAVGNATFSDLGGAVSDIFSATLGAEGENIKAQGEFAEGQEYTLAEQLARQNAQYTQQATAIKTQQAQRQIYQTIGTQQAQVGGGGFANSGTAQDLLRSSASQGALDKAAISQQGLITEAGYEEQANSYAIMASTAQQTGEAEQKMASQTQLFGDINAAIKGAAAIGTMFV